MKYNNFQNLNLIPRVIYLVSFVASKMLAAMGKTSPRTQVFWAGFVSYKLMTSKQYALTT